MDSCSEHTLSTGTESWWPTLTLIVHNGDSGRVSTMAGDVTLPETTKASVPSTKSSSKTLITRVWIVPLLAPARNPAHF